MAQLFQDQPGFEYTQTRGEDDGSTSYQIPFRQLQQRGHQVDNVTIDGHAQTHFGDKFGGDTIIHHHHVPQPEVNIYRKLLESLAFTRMEARLHNVARAMPRTCQWFLQHPDFIRWTQLDTCSEDQAFVWVKGKPGSGKSTIIKEALTWTQKTFPHRTVLSYFFNARAPDLLEKSSLGLYRSLLYQLLCDNAGLQSIFTTTFAAKYRGDLVDEWTPIELQNFFIELVSESHVAELTLFVDALDEGFDEDVQSMLAYLEDLAYHATSVNVPLRICLFSRHYPNVSIDHGISISLEDQDGHQDDIREYVFRKLCGARNTKMESLRQQVAEKAQGVFLWVVLVIPMLNSLHKQGNTPEALAKRLDTVPHKLHDLYDEILSHHRNDIGACLVLLQWVYFAERPLTATELFVAVQHTCQPQNTIEKTNIDKEVASRYVLDCSRGLVEEVEEVEDVEDVDRTAHPFQDSKVSDVGHTVVQFIHETVRESITKIAFASGKPYSMAENIPLPRNFQHLECHALLTQSCLKYLLSVHDSRKHWCGEIHNAYPLFFYAARHWNYHMQQAGKYAESLIAYAMEFFTNNNDRLWLWLNCSNVDSDYSIWEVPNLPPLVYLATIVAVPCLVRAVLDAGADVNAQGGRRGTALCAASLQGHSEIVLMLADKGADVNAQGGEYGTALSAASLRGHSEIVLMLADKGANVNTQGGDLGTALSAASFGGHQEIVQMLIDNGADVNAQGGDIGTALCTASRCGHSEIVRMLTDNGADVNAQGGVYDTALWAASEYGYSEIVQMLIDKEADVNAQGGVYGPALYTASRRGHSEIVRMLIDNGADVDAQGGICGTALWAASEYGYSEIVQMLIDNGADVNVIDNEGKTALDTAIMGGETEVQKILEAAGARRACELIDRAAPEISQQSGREDSDTDTLSE